MCVWKYLASSYNLNASMTKTGKAWFLSRLGRFVPGKITILLVRFNLYKGHSKKEVTAATVTEYIASLSAAGIIIFVSFAINRFELPSYIRFGALIYVVLIALLLFTNLLNRIINKMLLLIRKQPIDVFPSRRKRLGYLVIYLLPVLLHGLSFYFLVRSLMEIDFTYYLTLTGIYYSSAMIGLLAFFAPSGIGVREGIMFLFLPLMIIPEPVVITAAVMIRLVSTAAELLLAGVFTLADRSTSD